MGDLYGNMDTDQKQCSLIIVVMEVVLQSTILHFNSYLGAKAWFLFDLENLQLFANSEPFLVNETGWFPVGKTLQEDFRIQNPGDFNESFHVIGNNCLGFIFNMI